MISFHTVTLGGTNTESGSIICDYTLLPDDVPYPDVIINAYATNDMHYISVYKMYLHGMYVWLIIYCV